jgi:hypothetical protein
VSASAALAYSIFQISVLALILLWSCWFAWRRLLPRSYRGAQAGLAKHLSATSNASLRALGQHLTPQQVASGGGCGSGGGCSSCGTCASSATPAQSSDAQPLVFRPRVKH